MFTSLFDLFGNRFFRIPNYQRGYAWVEEQRKDLWEDIASLRDGMEHYAGTIVLRELDASAFPEGSFEREALLDPTTKAYDVVDGQQRLTTLVILVNELLRFIEQNTNIQDDNIPIDGVPNGWVSIADLKKRFLFRGNRLGGYYALDYVGDSEESNHLKTVVYEGGDGWEADRLTSYMRNLQNASKFFHDNIVALAERGGEEAVLDFLVRTIKRFRFNKIDLLDDYNVGVAFETMNNRGLQLSNLELLKNRLLYLTELFSKDQLTDPARSYLKKSIIKAWHTIYLQLGRDSRIVLNDDEFLKAHWSVYFMFTRRRGNACFDFLLRQQFVPNRLPGELSADVISGPVDPQEEVTDNDDDDDDNDAALGGGGLRELTPDMIKDYVDDLADFSAWWQKVHCPDRHGAGLQPQVVDELTRLRHLGMGYFKPLLAAAIKVGANHPKDVAALLRKIERFYFKAFRLGTSRSNYGQSEFLGVARKLYKGEISLQNLLTDDLWNHLENRDFVSQFKGKIADLRRKGVGFWKWNGIRYFLFEYNSELARERQRESSLVWEDYNRSSEGTVSIEHILPQKPEMWYWRNQFRSFNPDEMNLLTGALGNLLPLSLHINESLQNDPFERKKEGRPSRNGQHGVGGYRYGCAAEVEVSGKADWSANEIYSRSHELMDFLKRRWDVEISDDDEKEILGLEFVNDGREIPPELPNEPITSGSGTATESERHRTPQAERSAELKIPSRLITQALRSLIDENNTELTLKHGGNNLFSDTMDDLLPRRQDGDGGWPRCNEIYRFWVRPTEPKDGVNGVKLTLELGPGPNQGDKQANLNSLPEESRTNMIRIGGQDFMAWQQTKKGKIFRHDLFSKQCEPTEDAIREAIADLLSELEKWQKAAVNFSSPV